MSRPDKDDVLRSLFALAIAATLSSSAACDRDQQLATITSGGSGPPTLVLLHGYGSSAEQWAPFTQTIRLPPGGRFVFPQAPGLTSPPDGPPGGRGWWRLELASHIPSGRSVPDLSATQPPGLKAAASLVQELLETIERSPGGPIVLGGYSQGAMVATRSHSRLTWRSQVSSCCKQTSSIQGSWSIRFSHSRHSTPRSFCHTAATKSTAPAFQSRTPIQLEARNSRRPRDIWSIIYAVVIEIPPSELNELNFPVSSRHCGSRTSRHHAIGSCYRVFEFEAASASSEMLPQPALQSRPRLRHRSFQFQAIDPKKRHHRQEPDSFVAVPIWGSPSRRRRPRPSSEGPIPPVPFVLGTRQRRSSAFSSRMPRSPPCSRIWSL